MHHRHNGKPFGPTGRLSRPRARPASSSTRGGNGLVIGMYDSAYWARYIVRSDHSASRISCVRLHDNRKVAEDSLNRFCQGSGSGIKNLVAGFQCFLMQISAPSHHALVSQLRLFAIMSESSRACFIVAFHQNDMGM